MKKKRIDISNLNLYKNIFLNILFGTSLYLLLIRNYFTETIYGFSFPTTQSLTRPQIGRLCGIFVICQSTCLFITVAGGVPTRFILF